MSFNDMLKRMDKKALANFLEGVIARMSFDEWQDQQANEFVSLLRRLIQELDEAGEAATELKVYKVCYVRDGKEKNVVHFNSLSMAKKELKRRFKEIKRRPELATREEIELFGIENSLAPHVCTPILTNRNVLWQRRRPYPGRFNLYEFRFITETETIFPIQLMLIEVSLESIAQKPVKQAAKKNAGTVIKFDDI